MQDKFSTECNMQKMWDRLNKTCKMYELSFSLITSGRIQI